MSQLDVDQKALSRYAFVLTIAATILVFVYVITMSRMMFLVGLLLVMGGILGAVFFYGTAQRRL